MKFHQTPQIVKCTITKETVDGTGKPELIIDENKKEKSKKQKDIKQKKRKQHN